MNEINYIAPEKKWKNCFLFCEPYLNIQIDSITLSSHFSSGDMGDIGQSGPPGPQGNRVSITVFLINPFAKQT